METNFQKIVDGYALHSSPDMSKEAREMVVLSALGRIACHYRTKGRLNTMKDIFPNMYTIIFAGSGDGKDRLMKSIWEIPSFVDFLSAERTDLVQMKKIREEEERKKYLENNAKASDSQIRKWLDQEVKNPCPQMTDATRPYLEMSAMELSRYGIGQTHLINSEIIMWIKRKRIESFELLSYITDAFEGTSIDRKGTVTNNLSVEMQTIKNVPCNCLFFSASDLLKDDSTRGIFFDFYKVAGARRFFTVFSEKTNSMEERLANKNKEDSVHVATKIFQDFISVCEHAEERVKQYCANNTIEFSEETRELFYNVREEYKKKSEDTDVEDIIKTDIMAVPWRALKISILLALVNHPKEKTVFPEDFNQAIEITSRTTKGLMDLHTKYSGDDVKVVCDYILKNQDKKEIITRDLWALHSVKYGQSRWLNDLIPACVEYCSQNDLVFTNDKGKKGNTIIFRIDPLIKVAQVDTKTFDPVLNMSASYNMNIAAGYEVQKIKYKELGSLIHSEDEVHYVGGGFKCVYTGDDKPNMKKGSPTKYGYKSMENWEGGNNTFILDIDNDKHTFTIEQAKEFFKGVVFCIQPTKSHQIEKLKHGIKDRFRLIFPLSSNMDGADPVRFTRMMKVFAETFGVIDYVDDSSYCCSQMYYGSKHPIEYVEGDTVLMWESFDYEPIPEAKKFYKSYKDPVDGKIKSNEDPALDQHFMQCAYLTGDQKARHRCPCPGHDDKHASAFTQRSNTNNKLKMHCKSKCGTKWDRLGL